MTKGIYLTLMILLSISLLVYFAGCYSTSMDEKEARRILNDFYADTVPEPILDRHLLDAGKAIVPYLIVEVQRKDMPKRRYAIGALGKLGDKRALPTLTSILEDSSELIYLRADAIESIWHIDRKLGEEYARKYAGKSKEIDRTIELLRKGIL